METKNIYQLDLFWIGLVILIIGLAYIDSQREAECHNRWWEFREVVIEWGVDKNTCLFYNK